MRTLNTAILLSAAIAVAIATASDAANEDFSAFLARFAADSDFRTQRIDFPLRTIRGNPTDPRIKEKWSIAVVEERLIPPVPSADLDSRGLEQQVTYPTKTEVQVQQSRRASDSYILIYRFKQTRGQWRLVSYEDSSY